jgi:hypothetical protein
MVEGTGLDDGPDAVVVTGEDDAVDELEDV